MGSNSEASWMPSKGFCVCPQEMRSPLRRENEFPNKRRRAHYLLFLRFLTPKATTRTYRWFYFPVSSNINRHAFSFVLRSSLTSPFKQGDSLLAPSIKGWIRGRVFPETQFFNSSQSLGFTGERVTHERKCFCLWDCKSII